MRSTIFKSITVCMTTFAILSASAQNQSTNEALEACMQTTMATGAIAGAAVGALFGALLGNKNNRGQSAAIGAGLGGAAGGAIAWRNSWKSCTAKLNVVTLNNVKTQNYQDTAQRLGYNGQDTVFKLEVVEVSPQVPGGGQLVSSFQAVLLKPDPTQTSEIHVTRKWQCGDTVIETKREVFVAEQGTIIQHGRVVIPSAKADVGAQQCQMLVQVDGEGQSYKVVRPFVIQPN